jgi:hypothetical protein
MTLKMPSTDFKKETLLGVGDNNIVPWPILLSRGKDKKLIPT